METEFLIDNVTLRCICSNTKKRKELVLCENCGNSQHKLCVMKESNVKDKRYMCPICWKTVEKKIDSKTTIICSPLAIKNQWVEEINKHVKDPSFKVLVYDGVNGTGWISPYDLAEYDVIVTDFNVLSSEIYYTSDMSRNSRHKKKYVNPVSPLIFVNFWRVCLDEAQMVENTSNHVSKMVKTLSARHRWAVTGTPVEKSISSLLGLLNYLDMYPYYDTRIWKELCRNFCTGKNDQLIEVMGKVFWRTCKKDVIDEIGIPPQKKILHSVRMSDLEKVFYSTAHMEAEAEFKKYTSRIGYDENEKMSHMSHTLINSLLEHMRKLRQDCTIPSIFNRKTESCLVKQTLSPKELQDHLVSKHEIECKSQLRTVASSLNGMAAIHIAKSEFDPAIKCYKSVLKWDQENTGTIHVDALLKIHAIHNLIDISKITGNEEELKQFEDYEKEISKLKWKYIKRFYDNVHKKQLSVSIYDDRLAELNLKDLQGTWWRKILYTLEGNSVKSLLVDKIRMEIVSNNINAEIPEE